MPQPKVKSALLKQLPWWKLHASDYVYSVVEHGFAIPFSEIPLPAEAPNNKSARDHPDFVKKTIAEFSPHIFSN